MKNDSDRVLGAIRSRRARGWIEIGVGVALIAISMLVTRTVHHMLLYFAAAVPIVLGFIGLLRGTLRLLSIEHGLANPTAKQARTHGSLNLGVGFKSFVAWRYLMARDHRVSRIVVAVLYVALFLIVLAYVAKTTLITVDNPLGLERERLVGLATGVLLTMVIGFVLLFFALLIGGLRYVFSFFTTVPLVGVWIGTGALVCVLAVMSGFETDLRQKILGSNAHIQITKEDGDFTEWREIKAKVDKVTGVVASSPYAESEVVIAANQNGMNVIIKGIDPKTVGKVTDLVSDLKDKDALTRLEPLVEDTRDLTVPSQPQQGSDVVDPPPADMPGVGEPIDFSQPTGGNIDDPNQPIDDPTPSDASGEEPPPGEAPPPPLDEMPPPPATIAEMRGEADDAPGAADDVPPAADDAGEYGGDANAVQEPVLDPPPADFVTVDEPPRDYSGEDIDEAIRVLDVPLEPSLSRRTQLLPGILVGAELVKQTHLYTGEEVRVVSPLSDPSNPDATGTPIPFTRDYRVAGVFYTGMYEYDLKYVYVTLDSLTDFLDRGDAVDGIEVRVGSPDDTDIYVGRLQHLLGGQYRVQDWKQLNRSLFSALKLEKIAMFLVLGIVILVASFSIVGNLIMVVVEKGREIALLKTLGASDRNVMLVFTIQGMLIGLVGTALGISTGLLACWFGKMYGIPLDPDVYYIDRMPVHVDPTSVLVTAAAGILISMAATFYPALVAARVRPAAGMRH